MSLGMTRPSPVLTCCYDLNIIYFMLKRYLVRCWSPQVTLLDYGGIFTRKGTQKVFRLDHWGTPSESVKIDIIGPQLVASL